MKLHLMGRIALLLLHQEIIINLTKANIYADYRFLEGSGYTSPSGRREIYSPLRIAAHDQVNQFDDPESPKAKPIKSALSSTAPPLDENDSHQFRSVDQLIQQFSRPRQEVQQNFRSVRQKLSPETASIPDSFKHKAINQRQPRLDINMIGHSDRRLLNSKRKSHFPPPSRSSKKPHVRKPQKKVRQITKTFYLNNSPLYTLFDYDPLTLNGQLVLKAISKYLYDRQEQFRCAEFFTPPQHHPTNVWNQNPQKMLRVQLLPDRGILNFLNFHFSAILGPEVEQYKSKSIPAGIDEIEALHYRLVYEKFAEDFVPPGTSSMLIDYKNSIMIQFSNEIYGRWSKIFQKNPDEIEKMKHRMVLFCSLLPHYSLFVDMISAIIPIKNLDNGGELLQQERHTAGLVFFGVADRFIFEKEANAAKKSKYDSKYQNEDSEDQNFERTIGGILEGVSDESLSHPEFSLALQWKIIELWIQYYRPELVNVRTGDVWRPTQNHLPQKFKHFFNALLPYVL